MKRDRRKGCEYGWSRWSHRGKVAPAARWRVFNTIQCPHLSHLTPWPSYDNASPQLGLLTIKQQPIKTQKLAQMEPSSAPHSRQDVRTGLYISPSH